MYCNWVSLSITYFERLNKGIKKDSNANTTAQQFDQPGSSEQFEEADLDQFSDINDATNYSNEIKCVPGILEVVLKHHILITLNRSI